MYYLTCEQIRQYTKEILKKIGEKHDVRDIVFGGTECTTKTYSGYGFVIYDPDDGNPITVKYDGQTVFDFGAGYYYPGEWERVLKELYDAIPTILQKRAEQKAAERKMQQFVDDCRKYVMRWYTGIMPGGTVKSGGYNGKRILMFDDRIHGVEIYERRYKKYFLFSKEEDVLVFQERGEHGAKNVVLIDGPWREYVERLILEGKRRELEEKAAAKAEAEKKWNERLKPDDYINMIHSI